MAKRRDTQDAKRAPFERWEQRPRSRVDVRNRIELVIAEGRWHPIHGGGDGAAGKYLEYFTGIIGAVGNKDSADAYGLEVKTTRGKGKLTLFHQDPKKVEVDGEMVPAMRAMLQAYGTVKPGSGKKTLRYPIRGSTRFKLTREKDKLVCSPVGRLGPSVFWWTTDIEAAAIQKLRRAILVHCVLGQDNDGHRTVKYTSRMLLDNLISGAEITQIIQDGHLYVDLDCVEARSGSTGPDQNGAMDGAGTHFCVPIKNIPYLWKKLRGDTSPLAALGITNADLVALGVDGVITEPPIASRKGSKR